VVVDFHTHPWLPRYLNPPTEAFIREISPAVAQHDDRLSDPVYAADILRSQGVDRAVVLPEHCPETSGNVRTDTVLDFCAAVPDFFVPFASLHPDLDPDPAEALAAWIEAGVRGLKLYPSYQFFYPDEERLHPVYRVAQDAGIPLLVHVGSSVIPGTRLEYCHPRHLEPVARSFPGMPVVLAHGGRGHWYEECTRLTRELDNVYIDVTGLVPSRLLEHFPGLEALADRVVFGSDWPAMPKSVTHNVAAIRGLGLDADALDRILRRNALRLLGLDRDSQG
jgi:predicted TIM-barrel fold metal-dependent hydrolase